MRLCCNSAMSIRSSSPFVNRDEPDFAVSAMIDVAFLLLIYFIVTVTVSKQEADLAMTLPGISNVAGGPVQLDQMRIEVSATGEISINGEVLAESSQPREVPELVERLKRYSAMARIASSDPVVIVNCSGEVPEQRFVDVLNACSKAGISNLGITQ